MLTFIKIIAVALLILLTEGCSSFYYYPDKTTYIIGDRLPIRPIDFFCSVDRSTQIHGWQFKNQSNPRHPKAVILQFHGNGQNLSAHFASLYFALEHQIDLVTFDYEGYGRSNGAPSPRNTTRDGFAILNWVQDNYPKVPIIVVGQSLGGIIALKSLIEFQKQNNSLPPILLVFIDSSFSDYRSVAQKVVSKSYLTWWLQPLAWLIVDNSESPQNELKLIDNLRFLVVHGENDAVVPNSLGENLFNALPADKKFFKVPQGRHIDFFYRDRGQYQQPWLDLINGLLKHNAWPESPFYLIEK